MSPRLSDPGSYTWILLPDLQNYNKFERNQPILQMMINWIKNQRTELNIQMVLTVGDLVDRGNILAYDAPDKGDQSSYEQWKSLSSIFSKINGLMPYILCSGNHDYGEKIAENRYSQLNSFFPPQLNPVNKAMLIEMAMNAQGVKTLENAAYRWISPLGQGFLILSLEFAPRHQVLEWAKEMADRPEYKDDIGVVLTHSYLDTTGFRLTEVNYPLEDKNTGEEIWSKFINETKNIRFVFCGHINRSLLHTGHVGYSTDITTEGTLVHQMLFNAQREGGGHWGNGGDGWLRILEFMPDEETIKVYTFSPLFYVSPATCHLSWRREPYDEFIIKY